MITATIVFVGEVLTRENNKKHFHNKFLLTEKYAENGVIDLRTACQLNYYFVTRLCISATLCISEAA